MIASAVTSAADAATGGQEAAEHRRHAVFPAGHRLSFTFSILT
jgi:hypothetical protein